MIELTKEQLIDEIDTLRTRITELENKQNNHQPVDALNDLRQIYREAPVGLCLVDVNLRFVHINEMLAEINGLPVADHIGRQIRDVIPEIAEQVEPIYHRVIETRESLLGVRITGKTRANTDGEHQYLVSYLPFLSPRHEVLGVSSVVQDITDQAIAEESSELAHQELKSLLESVDLLTAIVEGTTDAIFVKNLAGQYLMVNSACAGVMGRSKEDILEKDDTQLFPPDTAKQLIEADRSIIATGRLVTIEETITPIGTDSERIFLSTKAPFFDKQGQIVGLIGISRDITDRQAAENQVRKVTADLQHASRLGVMGEMVSGISHELHQPLATIANYANGCRRRLEQGGFAQNEIIESIDQIAVQAIRAGQIIQRIRQFVAKGEFEPHSINVNGAIRDALQLAHPTILSGGVSVEESLFDELPPAFADRIQIIQTVLNLVINGIEAMKHLEQEERKLSIRSSIQSEKYVLIEVADVGAGVADDIRENIFDQFVTTKQGGLGIGLSVTRTIIEANGGQISFDSTPSSGSVFRFTLPRFGLVSSH